jgi:Sec-independent protein translocase protein TatA
MNFLGVGPLELIFILLIAIIVVGPRDISKTARTMGRFLNRLYHSEAWRTITEASRTIRGLPNRLAREAALEELDEVGQSLKQTKQEMSQELTGIDDGMKAWTTPSKPPADAGRKPPDQPSGVDPESDRE